jgi:hypothetical protein
MVKVQTSRVNDSNNYAHENDVPLNMKKQLITKKNSCERRVCKSERVEECGGRRRTRKYVPMLWLLQLEWSERKRPVDRRLYMKLL